MLAAMLFCMWASFSYAQEKQQFFFRMITAMSEVRTASYNFSGTDVFGDEIKTSELVVRLNVKPLKVYVYSITPHPGSRALFVEGENKNNILIDPNAFPYINLNLSPYHSLMRKGHHFTIKESGFEYVKNVMLNYYLKDSAAFFNALTINRHVKFKDTFYDQVVIEHPNFKYVDYKVLSGENFTSIGTKLCVNDDMIRLANPSLSGFNDLKAGTLIKVPNCFAKKIVFYVDPSNFLPVVQESYTEKGLYGRYVFSSLVINPVFPPEEFLRTNKEYGF